MGPAGKAPTPPNVSNQQLCLALCALPSPASVSDSLNSPALELPSSYRRSYSPHLTPRDGLLEAASPVPTEPGDIKIESVPTPPANDMPEPSMNLAVGGALAPTHTAPPSRPATRLQSGLRLPSFKMLGIAAPHPDRCGEQIEGLDSTLANAAGYPMQGSLRVQHADSELLEASEANRFGRSALDLLPDPNPEKPAGYAIRSPVPHCVDPLTPPAEVGNLEWRSTAIVTSAVDSPSMNPDLAAPGADDANIVAESAMTGFTPGFANNQAGDDEEEVWISGAIKVLSQRLLDLSNLTLADSSSQQSPQPSDWRFAQDTITCPS